ncbi:putative SWEET sugar transporter [Rosa chinensis]|uniref:Putative SWEET sugar transporter n=1 Tax=Rosa chinensis TaxID=74649 RepID=A0A2P6P4N6_ROSCH|nr:putative SWEET sugar transporter [Rosa chinensis]
MTSSTAHSPLVFAFGILGNIVSFIVFLAPVPTFFRVYKKKSTEGFQSVPYVFALFSATIWIYYASLKSDEMLLITINGFGCVIETIYIAMYITFAPKQARVKYQTLSPPPRPPPPPPPPPIKLLLINGVMELIFVVIKLQVNTLRLLLLVNFGGFCLILLLSHFLAQGPTRVKVLGWVCVAFSVSVFAAPLSIMRLVIRTKSVEFMPFSLSFFLTLSAIMWLFYGLLLKDLYVAAPNILGFSFGVAQMILYAIYRNSKTVIVDKEKLPEHKTADDIVKQINITVLPTSEVQVQVKEEAVSPARANNSDENDDHEQNEHDQREHVPQPCRVDAQGIDLVSKQVPVLVQCEV